MERILKQPVLVVNKPGAAGAIGAQTVATAKPDGYTIVIFEADAKRLAEGVRKVGRVETK